MSRRDDGFYGLNGPNQEALLSQHNYKKAMRDRDIEYEHEMDIARTIANGLSNIKFSSENYSSSDIWDADINIINADKVKQSAKFITNITLSDQQFQQLLEALKNK